MTREIVVGYKTLMEILASHFGIARWAREQKLSSYTMSIRVDWASKSILFIIRGEEDKDGQ